VKGAPRLMMTSLPMIGAPLSGCERARVFYISSTQLALGDAMVNCQTPYNVRDDRPKQVEKNAVTSNSCSMSSGSA
jgi:hypothetical protein